MEVFVRRHRPGRPEPNIAAIRYDEHLLHVAQTRGTSVEAMCDGCRKTAKSPIDVCTLMQSLRTVAYKRTGTPPRREAHLPRGALAPSTLENGKAVPRMYVIKMEADGCFSVHKSLK